MADRGCCDVLLVGQPGVLVLELWPNYQLETCILEVRNGHIVSKSTFSKDSYPLCHENVVRSLDVGTRKSTQTFSGQSFSRTLRVMDVRAENRGRPQQKVSFTAAPVMGRNFLSPGHPGVRVRNVRGKSGPKSLCICCFFFPEEGLPNIHKDCHGSSGFDVRCHFISNYQLGHPILKPCCELEHAGRHLSWQCV